MIFYIYIWFWFCFLNILGKILPRNILIRRANFMKFPLYKIKNSVEKSSQPFCHFILEVCVNSGIQQRMLYWLLWKVVTLHFAPARDLHLLPLVAGYSEVNCCTE